MTEWAPGAKPSPSENVYRLLGKSAATSHYVADSYVLKYNRVSLGVEKLLDEQFALLRPSLEDRDRWDEVENALRTVSKRIG